MFACTSEVGRKVLSVSRTLMLPLYAMLLVSVAPAQHVNSLQFISQTVPVEVIDGVPRTAPKRVLACEQADYFGGTTAFQILDDSTDILYPVSVRCHPETREYELHLSSLIPRVSRLARSTTSVSRNSARFLDSNITDPNSIPSQADDPAGRKLLWATMTQCMQDTGRETCQMIHHFTKTGIAIQLKISHSGQENPFARPAADAKIGYTELLAAYCSDMGPGTEYVSFTDLYGQHWDHQACYKGVSPSRYNDTAKAVKDAADAFRTYGQSAALTEVQKSHVFKNLTLLGSDLAAYLNASNAALGLLQYQANLTRVMAEKTRNDTTLQLKDRADKVAGIDKDISATADLMNRIVNQTSSTLEFLMLRSSNNKQASSSGLQRLLYYAYDLEGYNSQQIRYASTGITDASTVMWKMANNDFMIDQQSENVHRLLNEPSTYMSPYNTVMVPFTEITGEAGVPPIINENDLPPDIEVTLKHRFTINVALIMQNSQLYGVVSTVEVYCSTAYLLGDSYVFSPRIDDIYTMLGPADCIANYTLGVVPLIQRCICYSKMIEKRCHLLGMQYVKGWLDTGNREDGCLDDYSNSFPGGYDERTTLQTVTDLAEMFANITRRGRPVAGSSYMITTLTGLKGPADYDPALLDVARFRVLSSSLNYNVTETGEQTSDKLNNLAFWFGRSAEDAFAFTANNMTDKRLIVKGSPPNRMTQEQRLFTRTVRGDTGPTSTFSILLSEHQFLSVMVPVLTTIEASIEVSLNGAPFIRYTDVSLGNTHEELLRHDSMFAMVVDPLTFESTQYDIPDKAISLSAFAGARRWHVDYVSTPTPEEYNMNDWMKRELIDFDHTAADHSASWYRVDLDTDPSSLTYGQCKGDLPIFLGEWCVRRQYFTIQIQGPLNDYSQNGRMTLQSTSSIVSTQVDLANGDIFFTTASVCPDVEEIAINGERLLIQLINTVPDTDNRFRVTQTGTCNSTQLITLHGGQKFTFSATRCLSAPINQPDVLGFSYTQSDGTWGACPTTITLSYDPQTITQFTGSGSLGAVVELTTNRVNAILIYVHALELNALGALQDQLVNNLNMEVDAIGYRVDQSVVDVTSGFSQIIKDLIDLGNRETLEAKNNFTVYLTDEILAEFNERMNAAREKFNAAFAATQPLLEKLIQDDANAKASLDLLLAFMARQHDAAEVMTRTFGRMLGGLVNAIGELRRETPNTTFVGLDDQSSWNELADLILGQDGTVAGLVGLFIKDPLSWFSNALNLTGGSIKGIVTWLLIIAGILLALVSVIWTAVDFNAFVIQQSGSKADEIARQEIYGKLHTKDD